MVEPARRLSAASWQGLAAQLWQQGKSWAIAQGARVIGLDTALPAEHLIALYERWGFVQRDTIHWPGKTYHSTIMIRPLP